MTDEKPQSQDQDSQAPKEPDTGQQDSQQAQQAEQAEQPTPKIVVDEDWKAQAQEEKRRLAEQERATRAPSPVGGRMDQAAPGAAGATRELPPASFATLVSSVVTQILFALGAFPDPQTGRRYRNLALAKHHIDVLGILEEKTKGNLTPEEKQLLDGALYEVRMAFVQAAQGGR